MGSIDIEKGWENDYSKRDELAEATVYGAVRVVAFGSALLHSVKEVVKVIGGSHRTNSFHLGGCSLNVSLPEEIDSLERAHNAHASDGSIAPGQNTSGYDGRRKW